MIKLVNVSKTFGDREALKNINLEIKDGETLAIIGGSGSGKSTLMRAMLGLVKPRGGQIVYGDGLQKNQIGYLPQQTQKTGSSTVTVPFDRQALADYLGVERSAMSAELGKLQRDGVLTTNRNQFCLL